MKLRPRYPLLFLFSLVVASLLWYGLAERRREPVSVRGIRAVLFTVNLPQELVVTSEKPETVNVQLRGPISRTLEFRDHLEVWLDLSDARSGVQTFRIREDFVQIPANESISVVAIDPPEISLEIEQLETVVVPVRVPLEGEPAPGYEVREVQVTPDRLSVQGPGSLLATLSEVETSPLSIDGATTSIEGTVQALLPHPLLESTAGVSLLVSIEVVPQAEASGETGSNQEDSRQ